MTAEELADQLGADSRPLSRKARKARRRQPADLALPLEPARAAPGEPDLPSTPTAQPPLAHQRWDVEAVDSAGHLLVAWRGVEVHDAGPLPRNAAWPPALLSVYLEGSAVSLGLDRALQVTVSCGQPAGPAPQFLSAAVPRQAAGGHVEPGTGRSATADAGQASANGDGQGPHHATAAGTGALDGFTLAVTAAMPVACGWTAVDAARRAGQPTAAMAVAYGRMREQLAEPPAVLAARLRAISACLAAGGHSGGAPVSCDCVTGDGWALLTAGRASIACAVVDISGVPSPVALAILTAQAAGDEMAAAADTAGTVTAPVP